MKNFMQVPFVNPLSASLLFLQALLLFLRYQGVKGIKNAHIGIVLIPVFLAEIFLVVLLISEALFESAYRRRKEVNVYDTTGTKLSCILLELVTAVLIMLTTVLYVFYLDEDTDLPLYWITTTFFVATLVFFIMTLVMFYTTWTNSLVKKTDALVTEPYETLKEKGFRVVFVGFLVFVQGLFFWLYNGPWGRAFNTNLFWILLPTIIFLVLSFVVTLRQTFYRITKKGPHLVRQGAFLLLILLAVVSLILLILHLEYDIIAPKWIVLPIMIYAGLLIFVSLYITYELKRYRRVVYHEPPKSISEEPTQEEIYYATLQQQGANTYNFVTFKDSTEPKKTQENYYEMHHYNNQTVIKY